MTAHPLRLVSSAASGLGWHWLTSGVEIATLASGNWLLAADRAARDPTCCPRIATRTAGADARSVRAARDFADATLRRWGVPGRCDDVAVVVSELLTNALRHSPPAGDVRSRWQIRVGLLQSGPCVLCAVADPSETPPVPKEPDHLAESGRGLEVVSALSDEWGYSTVSDMGKVVWATFSTEPGPRRASADPGPDWRVRQASAWR
jgi:anti-sigma regulatory factor (Ser/Thr protein kinase)